MKELFEMRAMELANRHLLRQRSDTESFVVSEGNDEIWAFPRNSLFRLVETKVLNCPTQASWREFPCTSLLNFNTVVYPVIDWFEVTGSARDRRLDSLYALSFEPAIAIALPRTTSIRDLDVSNRKPTKRQFASALLDGVLIADWSVFL